METGRKMEAGSPPLPIYCLVDEPTLLLLYDPIFPDHVNRISADLPGLTGPGSGEAWNTLTMMTWCGIV